jgi:hypothetical protein
VAGKLMPLVYNELRQIVRWQLAHEPPARASDVIRIDLNEID